MDNRVCIKASHLVLLLFCYIAMIANFDLIKNTCRPNHYWMYSRVIVPVGKAGDIATRSSVSPCVCVCVCVCVYLTLSCLHDNSKNTGAISSSILWALSGLLASTSLHLDSLWLYQKSCHGNTIISSNSNSFSELRNNRLGFQVTSHTWLENATA